MTDVVPFQCDFVVIDGRKFYAEDHLIKFVRTLPRHVHISFLETAFIHASIQSQPVAGSA